MKVYINPNQNFHKVDKSGNIILFCFLLCLVLIVSYRMYAYSASGSESYFGRDRRIYGYVYQHPYISDSLQTFKIAGLTIKASKYPEYKLGDYLLVEVDSKSKYVSYYPNIQIIDDKSDIVLQAVSKLRSRLVLSIKKQLPEPYASLILGMTIGYKADFPDYFSKSLKQAGLIHVIVVSGYNVSLILVFLTVLLRFLGGKGYVVVSGVFLIIFTILAGFDPPIIRAVITGIISMIGYVSGKYRHSFYLLFLAGIIMLAVSPAQLFGLSFQLSFLASLGVLLAGSLSVNLKESFRGFFVIVGANLFIAPILLYNFGYFSLASLPANLLIAWTIPLLTISGIILFIVPLFPVQIFSMVLINFFVLVTNTAGRFESLIITRQIGVTQIVLYYVYLILFIKLIYSFKND